MEYSKHNGQLLSKWFATQSLILAVTKRALSVGVKILHESIFNVIYAGPFY